MLTPELQKKVEESENLASARWRTGKSTYVVVVWAHDNKGNRTEVFRTEGKTKAAAKTDMDVEYEKMEAIKQAAVKG